MTAIRHTEVPREAGADKRPSDEVRERTAPAGQRALPSILFLHGAWHGAWCWDRFSGYFRERGFPCHSLDLDGHGARPRPPGFDRMLVRDHLPRLAGAVRELAGDLAPVIVAHSMGGWVTQMLLASADAPPLGGAVLVTPVPAAGVPIATSAKILIQYPLSFARANFLLSVPIKDTRMARRLFHTREKPEAEVAASHAKLVPESALSCLDMVLGISRVKARPARVPALVISAEHDYFFPPACEKRLAAGLAADYLEYGGMAHNLMEDARWREVAQAIEGWIEAKAVSREAASTRPEPPPAA